MVGFIRECKLCTPDLQNYVTILSFQIRRSVGQTLKALQYSVEVQLAIDRFPVVNDSNTVTRARVIREIDTRNAKNLDLLCLTFSGVKLVNSLLNLGFRVFIKQLCCGGSFEYRKTVLCGSNNIKLYC